MIEERSALAVSALVNALASVSLINLAAAAAASPAA